jgi:branched-chain amino acid transport system ATP-binding protein
MVGQHSLLKSGFWASALKRRFTRAEERAAREEAMKLLYLVGLHDKAHLQGSSLAYGELRTLELARALASNASVLLLDEPAAGMNETETVMLMSLVKQVAGDRHISVLLVEHNMTAVMNYSRTISVLDQGKKITEGVPEEIKNDCRVIESYMGRRNK